MGYVLVAGRMDVPELLGLPLLGHGEAPAFKVARLEGPAREGTDVAAVLADHDAKRVSGVRQKALQRDGERGFPLTNRRVHLHVPDAGGGGRADEVDVAAQTGAFHRTFYFPGRVGVAVGEQDALERHGENEEAEDVLAAGPASGGEVDLARRKAHLARFLAVHVQDGERVQILRGQGDAAAGPSRGDGDFSLIPGPGDAAHGGLLPARMGEERLAVFLNVAGATRPEPGNLEVPPSVCGNRVRNRPGRLPAPQTVQADALARGRLFTEGPVQVPDHLDAWR